MKLILIIFLVVLIIFLGVKNVKNVKNVNVENVKNVKKVRKNVTGVVKEVYLSQRAVPRKYQEMSQIVEDFKSSNRWEKIVEMGDIYARGFFPYLKPDEKVALACYEAASQCPDRLVRGNAAAKINSMTVAEEDRLGGKMDVRYGESIVKLARKSIENPKPTELEIRNFNMRKKSNVKTNVKINVKTPTPNLDRIGGGSQNTHDHGVTSATKTNIKRLAEDFKNAGGRLRKEADVVDEAVIMCRNLCDSKTEAGFDGNKLVDAHRVIVSLSPDEYSGTGVSQMQILDMVLWKISTIPDKEVRENVGNTLCKRLSSGFENGFVVCGTGKVSRVISVFEGVFENIQKAVSINLVEKEISSLASKVRDDFLNKVGPIGRRAYESDNSVPEYAVTMSNILKAKVQEEYVHKLNMKESVINPLVEVYAGAY